MVLKGYPMVYTVKGYPTVYKGYPMVYTGSPYGLGTVQIYSTVWIYSVFRCGEVVGFCGEWVRQ